jgi:aspartate carbamoyltransferase regulatory subunit
MTIVHVFIDRNVHELVPSLKLCITCPTANQLLVIKQDYKIVEFHSIRLPRNINKVLNHIKTCTSDSTTSDISKSFEHRVRKNLTVFF